MSVHLPVQLGLRILSGTLSARIARRHQPGKHAGNRAAPNPVSSNSDLTSKGCCLPGAEAGTLYLVRVVW